MNTRSGLRLFLAVAAGAALATAGVSYGAESIRPPGTDQWSQADRAVLRSLWIESLPAPPPDPSNRVADDPAAARLGERLFFDTRFSANGEVACATCHRATYDFTDPLPQGKGMGQVRRRTMPLIGMAYQNWFFWDGRSDSLWAQALEPPRQPLEQGITPTIFVRLLYRYYREDYETVFGPMPDPDAARSPSGQEDRAVTTAYVNAGKAIAAFERRIVPAASRFDHYVAAVLRDDADRFPVLTVDEVTGLRLFIGKAQCTNCHSGPLFTNGSFHATGMPPGPEADQGRAEAIPVVREKEFGCLGAFSDADPKTDCAHVRFMDDDATKYRDAFKTPTLRDVADHPPYMHQGQLATLEAVLKAYRDSAQSSQHRDLHHADLTDAEINQLVAFLKTLSSPLQIRR